MRLSYIVINENCQLQNYELGIGNLYARVEAISLKLNKQKSSICKYPLCKIITDLGIDELLFFSIF